MGSGIYTTETRQQAEEVGHTSQEQSGYHKFHHPPLKIKQAQGCGGHSNGQEEWISSHKTFRLHTLVLPTFGKGRYQDRSPPPQ